MVQRMTLNDAQNQLNKWLAADTAAAKGQSYSIDGLSLSRVDADQITQKISYWQKQVNSLTQQTNGQTPGVKFASFNA